MGVEVCIARTRRRLRVDHHGDALPPRGIEVESNRSPHVQFDQRELGRRTVAKLRNDPEAYSDDAFGCRFSLSCLSRRTRLREAKDHRQAKGVDPPETANS